MTWPTTSYEITLATSVAGQSSSVDPRSVEELSVNAVSSGDAGAWVGLLG